MSVEVDNCTISCGEIENLLPVGIDYAAVGRGAPSVVGIAGATVSIWGKNLCGAVGEGLLGCGIGVVIAVETHSVGGPADGEGSADGAGVAACASSDNSASARSGIVGPR